MQRATDSLLPSLVCWLVFWGCFPARGSETLRLENPFLDLRFDGDSGTLLALSNKLTGETYGIVGDQFSVETTDFHVAFRDAKLVSLRQVVGGVEAAYSHDRLDIQVAYALSAKRHFAEKRVTLTFKQPCGVKRIIVGQPSFSGGDVRIVPYRYPKFMRTPGSEPSCTFFGRTAKGGFFTGVEMPFDVSTGSGQQVVLAYRPSLKVAAGEKLACEPVYFGVYQRGPQDREEKDLPLKAESEAMVAMTSAILGPPRHGLVPMACGWHSEMSHVTFRSVQDVEADMKSLDFLAQCGVDWLSDSHPWGGETEKMHSLLDGQPYRLGDLYRRFLEHARHAGVNVAMWGTLNNSHPWGNGGRPFRPDKPEWLMTIAKENYRTNQIILGAKGNCLANRSFADWLTRVNLEGLATGYYPSLGHRRRLLRRRGMVHLRDSGDLHVGPARSLARRLQLRVPAGTPGIDRHRAPALSQDLHLHVSAADGLGRLVTEKRRCLFHALGDGHVRQPHRGRPNPPLVAHPGPS